MNSTAQKQSIAFDAINQLLTEQSSVAGPMFISELSFQITLFNLAKNLLDSGLAPDSAEVSQIVSALGKATTKRLMGESAILAEAEDRGSEDLFDDELEELREMTE